MLILQLINCIGTVVLVKTVYDFELHLKLFVVDALAIPFVQQIGLYSLLHPKEERPSCPVFKNID